MVYKRALRFLEQAPGVVEKYTPARMQALCNALGRVNTGSRYLYVANTTIGHAASRMLASVLCSAGYRVGHIAVRQISEVRERFRINDAPISAGKLCEYVGEVSRVVAELQTKSYSLGPFSTEELMLATGLLACRCNACEIVLVEGACGKTQPTAICTPFDLCILPTVGTSEQAALRQIRPFVDAVRRGTREVIGGIRGGEAYELLSDACARTGSRLSVPATAEYTLQKQAVSGAVFDYRGKTEYRISGGSSLLLRAALIALESAFSLRRDGVRIPGTALYEGLARARVPLICVPISFSPRILMDGTTDPDELDATAELLGKMSPDGRMYVCCKPDAPSPTERYPDAIPAEITDISQALSMLQTLRAPDTLLCYGSLYDVGQWKDIFLRALEKDATRSRR